MRKELAENGLEAASKLGASYADIRFVDGERRQVSTKDGKPSGISYSSESGFGVRVIVNNGWGFAGSYKVSREDVNRVVEQAVKIAKASSKIAKDPIKLAPVKIVEDKYTSDFKIDPMTVPLEEILELLLDADLRPQCDFEHPGGCLPHLHGARRSIGPDLCPRRHRQRERPRPHPRRGRGHREQPTAPFRRGTRSGTGHAKRGRPRRDRQYRSRRRHPDELPLEADRR